MPELLLEVGFEEMPAPWLEGRGVELALKFTEIAQREFLEPKTRDDVPPLWTPRRLVLRAEVLARQADREERVWGPALKVAKDTSGNWTGAAQGFAKKSGVAVEALQLGAKDAAKPDDRYLFHVKKTIGRPAGEVLPGVIATTLRSLTFPRRMSWDAWLDDGKGALPFGRPIRWLLVLFDGSVIPFVIYEMVAGAKGRALVVSGNSTFGHRFLPKHLAGKAIGPIRSFAELKERLAGSFVLLDPAERSKRITEGLQTLGNGLVPDDHGLRQEWRDLVEYPTVVSGSIPAEFQALPREVLETVLVHHQKYIPLPAPDGTVDRFAAVINGDGAAAQSIVRGMERVVVARLRDAAFFYVEDRKRPLPERVDDLRGVTFHKELGSYKDKTDRMVQLVHTMAEEELLTREQRQDAAEAARLAKADLTTLMVREFPELQGTIGGLYLRDQGASQRVVKAVYWHYHPIFIGQDAVPAGAFHHDDNRVFAAVSVADKLDTLAGYFGIGEDPTGSRDPYGLRRAAQGAIRALLDFWCTGPGEKRPSLKILIEAAIKGYGRTLKRPSREVIGPLELFLLDRLEYVLTYRGFPPEEVGAAIYTPGVEALGDPADVVVRLEALHRVRAEKEREFAALAENFKRVNNILAEGVPAASVDPQLISEPAEGALLEEVSKQEKADGSYEERLRAIATLRAPIARFFDEVRVIVDDAAVRGNRLALLKRTRSLFYRIADISKLGGSA